MVELLLKMAAASLGFATLVAITPAQAEVVCNRDGDCWHAREAYNYPSTAGVVVHPNDWSWTGDRYRWHEHPGRGYWNGHVWTVF